MGPQRQELTGPSDGEILHSFAVDAASRVLRTSLRKDEICRLSALVLEHGHRLLAEQNPALLENLGGASFPTGDRLVLGRLLHEHDHLCRFLYTPYGLLLHRLRSATIDGFFQAVRAFQGGAQEDEWRYVDGELATVALSGQYEPGAPPNRGILGTFLDLVGLRVTPGPDESISTRLSAFLAEEHPSPSFQGQPFGGRALLEALAMNREITVTRYAAASNREWRPMLDPKRQGMQDYNLAQVFWRSLLKSSMVPPPERMKRAWLAAGPVTTKNVLPLEFNTAVDFALWLPFWPPDSSRAHVSVPWTDLHPGWRFLRICEHLDQRTYGFWSHDDYASYVEGRHETLQNEIADALGWPHPRELAEAWENWCSRIVRGAELARFFIESDLSRLRATGELLATWRANPGALNTGLLDFGGRKHHWFSAIETGDRLLCDPAPPHPERLPICYAVSYGERFLAKGDRCGRYFDDDAVLISTLARYADKHYGISEPNFLRIAKALLSCP